MNCNLVLLALAGGALAACAAPVGGKSDRRQVQQSSVEESFTFSSQAEAVGHDPKDLAAEAARIDDLERHLRANQMCPKGYTITARRAIIQTGEKDQVDYQGRCKA